MLSRQVSAINSSDNILGTLEDALVRILIDGGWMMDLYVKIDENALLNIHKGDSVRVIDESFSFLAKGIRY